MVDWLPSLRLAHLEPVFHDNEINGDRLLSLTRADLVEMGAEVRPSACRPARAMKPPSHMTPRILT